MLQAHFSIYALKSFGTSTQYDCLPSNNTPQEFGKDKSMPSIFKLRKSLAFIDQIL